MSFDGKARDDERPSRERGLVDPGGLASPFLEGHISCLCIKDFQENTSAQTHDGSRAAPHHGQGQQKGKRQELEGQKHEGKKRPM